MKNNKTEKSRGYRICYALFAGIVGFLLRIKVVGREAEPDGGGFLVCANHASATDPVVICYAFRKHQIRFMAKLELFKIPLLSSLIKMLGAFPIDRSGADVGAIKHSVEMLGEGKCVGIFPQGHRYAGKEPRETGTKNGAALIFSRAKCDIVPVYIWRKKNKFRLFSRTYVIIGERIPFDTLGCTEPSTAEYKRMTEIVFDKICTLGEGFDPKALKGKKK